MSSPLTVELILNMILFVNKKINWHTFQIVKQDTKRNFYVWLLREEGRGAYILE